MLITREQLLYLYPSVANYVDIFYSVPQTDAELLFKYLPSKLWRLNNLYTITDINANRIKFKMRFGQHYVYAKSLEHARLIILKSRQQGISTLWLISYLDDVIFHTDIKAGLMAQGTDEAIDLLTKVKLAWEKFPQSIKSFLDVKKTYDNRSEFAFSNGSVMYIRTSFRSATLQRLHISEFAKIANTSPMKAKEVKTGTLQTLHPGNTGIIESTAEGENEFKFMWDSAVLFVGLGVSTPQKVDKLTPKDFLPVFLSWLDDPKCRFDKLQEINPTHEKYFSGLETELKIKLSVEQKNFWVAQYRELGDFTYQEYPATPEEAFRKNLDGAFYARLYTAYVIKQGRELSDLYDPNLDVHLAFDLGMNDSMVIIFFQIYNGHSGREYRIIHDYKNSGEPIKYYTDYVRDRSSEFGYSIGWTLLPHDAAVTELIAGQKRVQEFISQGLTKVSVIPKVKHAEGVELVRQMLKYLWVDRTCTYSISCFKNYSKIWDDSAQVWKKDAVHDIYSHGADAIRYMALGSEIVFANREYDNFSDVVDGISL